MRTILTFIFMLSMQFVLGQTSDDYFNEEVKGAQMKTARFVMRALEKGDIEFAVTYFDNSIDGVESDLSNIAAEISKVKAETKLSIVIVFIQGFNIYRCRYYNENGVLYQLDLYLTSGNPNSKVKKFETKDSAILKKERKKRMEMTNPPPPPSLN